MKQIGTNEAFSHASLDQEAVVKDFKTKDRPTKKRLQQTPNNNKEVDMIYE
jgi:hypothetical protein